MKWIFFALFQYKPFPHQDKKSLEYVNRNLSFSMSFFFMLTQRNNVAFILVCKKAPAKGLEPSTINLKG